MHAHKTLAPISNISMDRLHHEVLTLELSNIIIKVVTELNFWVDRTAV